MDRFVDVRTPESVAFSHELAGLGSRFLAVAVDMVIQMLLLAGILWGLSFGSSVGSSRQTMHLSTSILIAIVAVILFVVLFGYFVLFEAFWNGRTPGKALLGLRVVRDGGYAIDFASAAIRNLVRVGELTVGFYAISAVVTILSPENKRLGDMAAGTIVVRDARSATLAAIVARGEQESVSTLLTPQEYALAERFLLRRGSMAAWPRAQIAAQIADRVRPRLSPDLRRLGDEELLERLSGS